jgi:hypothetical protein
MKAEMTAAQLELQLEQWWAALMDDWKEML